MEKRELVIIGAGPAGLTAAIYGRRAGLDVLLLENGVAGGQANLTDKIENWPGTISIPGMELAKAFRDHAEHFKAEIRDVRVDSLELRSGMKIIKTNKGEIEADAVILATGAGFRKLGCRGEEEFTGAGVSYCAVCDAAFFQDSVIAVVGGGNAAVEEALYLTNFASKIYLIHRRDEFRADRASVEEILSNKKIVPVMDTVVESIDGDGLVSGITIKNVKSGEISRLDLSGVFIFTGTKPNVSYLGDENSIVKQSKGGWIVTDEKMATSAEGIFAAGDLREKSLRQVVTAAGDGATAAMSAYAYVSQQVRLRSVLLEPAHVTALFVSQIDEDQARLLSEAEKYSADSGHAIVTVDAYRNTLMPAKLGIKELPTIAALEHGKVVRSLKISSVGDIEKFVSGTGNA